MGGSRSFSAISREWSTACDGVVTGADDGRAKQAREANEVGASITCCSTGGTGNEATSGLTWSTDHEHLNAPYFEHYIGASSVLMPRSKCGVYAIIGAVGRARR